jgi:hypothetical protein
MSPKDVIINPGKSLILKDHDAVQNKMLQGALVLIYPLKK